MIPERLRSDRARLHLFPDSSHSTGCDRERLSRAAYFLALLIGCIAVALGLASALLAATGAPPGVVWDAMLKGSVGSTAALGTTLNYTALVLTVAIGTCIAFRAGLFNIGQEGQFTIGGIAGTAVGLALPFRGILAIVVIVVAAAVGGALWALFPAYLKLHRGVSEVVTTLLMDFVAFQLLSFVVNKPYLLGERLPKGSLLSGQPQSNLLPGADLLPSLAEGVGYRLQITIVVAIALALVSSFLIARSRWGLRVRASGFNPHIMQRMGIRRWQIGGGALLISGAFAGLAGGFLLTGTVLRIQGGVSTGVVGSFSDNFGWEGLLVALVARFRPSIAIPVAFLFGALRAGGEVLASTGVDSSIVGVVQALVVLAVTIPTVVAQVHAQRTRAKSLLDYA